MKKGPAKKILLIDDDMDFIDMLRDNLVRRGYEVVYAYDGASGIEKIRREEPHLIIMDILLPDMDGHKITDLFKSDSRYSHIPIIVFSSHYGDRMSYSKTRADAYIAKSTGERGLYEKIDSLLKGKAQKAFDIRIEYPPMPFLKEEKDAKDMSIDELKQKISHLAAINEIVYDVNRTLEIDTCIKKFIDKIGEILSSEIIPLMLLDKKKNELAIKMAKGMKEEIVKNARARLGEGVAGWVAKEGKPLLVDDVDKFPHFKTKNGRPYKTNSFISVPLIVDDEVLGVVNVTDKRDKSAFTKDDLDTLTTIANNTASAIKNSLTYEEMKRLNKVKSEFLAILAHELKAPLVNIKGSIELLLENVGTALKTEETRFLEIAKDNIGRLTRLIDDLLDISKLESGAVAMKRDRLSMTSIIKSAAASFKPTFDKKAISFELKLPADEKMVWGDSDKLEQVLNNLLSNAAKFTPEKGRVALLLEDSGENILLTVSDNGPGIPKEDIPKVFDKFSSLSVEKRSGIIKGTGLGLAITKDIVGMHRGSIWVESEPGVGSRFFVELPKDLRKK